MERKVGTVARGVRCPIIREGDDLAEIVCASVIEASESESYEIADHDIIGLTESILARAQGNYASIEVISKDIASKLGSETIGVVFPIFSRNRFSVLLRAVAMAAKKIVLVLQYPSDEVGNALLSLEQLDASSINPYSDTLTLKEFRDAFGKSVHPFTGIDYVDFYQNIIEEAGAEAEIIFSNDAKKVLEYTENVLASDVHSNKRTMKVLRENGAKNLFALDDILTESVDGSGYNEKYGLLGSNMSSDHSVKLFPRASVAMVNKIQALMFEKTGKQVEVMVYGDGAFKDPMGEIWELADPTVAPGYTKGLEGTPNEIKLKYLADNDFEDLSGDQLKAAITKEIEAKDNREAGGNASLGTTPRRIVDLVGSLCDLTSGSGDKGTPIVHIQGYFDNFSTK